MTSRPFLSLVLVALSTAALTAAGCASTVSGGDAGSTEDGGADDDGSTDDGEGAGDSDGDGDGDGDGDDGGECGGREEPACNHGPPFCSDGTWSCPGVGCDPRNEPTCSGGPATCHMGSQWSCPGQAICPETQPEADTSCPQLATGLVCTYEIELECGPGSITLECGLYQWKLVETRCGPPCRDLDQETCLAHDCRWLEPGCGESPLAEAGCFDATDCYEGGCLMGDEQCMVVSIDPCAGADCGACASDVSLCIPQVVGE